MQINFNRETPTLDAIIKFYFTWITDDQGRTMMPADCMEKTRMMDIVEFCMKSNKLSNEAKDLFIKYRARK